MPIPCPRYAYESKTMKILVAGEPRFKDEILVEKVLNALSPTALCHPGFVGLAKLIDSYAIRHGISVRNYPLARYRVNGYLSPDTRADAIFKENPDIFLAVFFGMGDASKLLYKRAGLRGIKTFTLQGLTFSHPKVLEELEIFKLSSCGMA